MEQRRQRGSAASVAAPPLGWEEISDDQGRNGCCNILAHQMTRVGRVAGMSAIGHPEEACVEVSDLSLQISTVF